MSRVGRGPGDSAPSADSASVYPPSEDTDLLLSALAMDGPLAGLPVEHPATRRMTNQGN